jgi:phage major head subunit gpT-like protein
MDFESNMRLIVENTYATLASTLWWSDVARVLPSKSKREVIAWLISTATLEDQGDGGNQEYDTIEATYTEIANRNVGKGLEIARNQLEDLDGNGIQAATQWSSDIGSAFAYWPQERVSYLMKHGETAAIATGYDAKALFAVDHPANPVLSNGVTFANFFTGDAYGGSAPPAGCDAYYPGALPIHESVTADVALANMSKLVSYMARVKQPNGQYPRRLRPVGWFVPPALMSRGTLLTDARFIAMSAGAAAAQGGSTDVQGMIAKLNFGAPVVCDELGASFDGGSDTTYYVVFAPLGGARSTLGGIVYLEREAFSVTYHGPMTSAELARQRKFQWLADGRNAVAPGHPYEIVKVCAT